MACALLPYPSMESDPGQVIRSLRMALEMSQAEFARASGWSASTISSWERGRAKPSRLAFKTILAFAEERGIRYRPRSTSTALVLAQPQLESANGYASARPGHDPRAPRVERLPAGPAPHLRPLLYADPVTHAAHSPVEPPRWSAEASFRFTLGGRPHRSLPRGIAEAGIVALAFCAAWLLAEPVQRWLRPAPPVVATASAPPLVPAALPGGAAQLPSITAPPAPAVAPMLVPADAPPEPAVDAAPAPLVTARLESILTIGGEARATFRTPNDAVTVETGEWLGSQQISRIADDGVTLLDRAGISRRVHVGQQINFD
ncbi:MAG TPA: helix-turn-helix domain-containing protein [Candidatus Binatia bacterium]|jgi:transcriptional regulator with XRE-family HTH domain